MGKTIKIKFDISSDPSDPHQYGHRIWNFAEDLWRELERAGLADLGGLDRVDAVKDCIEIRVKHNKKFGRVRQHVETKLKSAFPDGVGTISYD